MLFVLRVMWLQKLQILETNKALQELGLVEHQLRFTSTVVVNFSGALTNLAELVYELLKRFVLYSCWAKINQYSPIS